MVTPGHGEIWWGERPNGKPRPYLVLTRDAAIPVLRKILVAPVTSTVRAIPTELPLGPDEGLRMECVASFDNVYAIRKAYLTRRMGALGQERRHEVCLALAAAVDC